MTRTNAQNPAPASTPADSATNPAPAASGGANAHHRGVEVQAVQGAALLAAEALRLPFANWILDYVPDAHLLDAQKIAKFLPLAAVLFKVATPEGPVLNFTDEVVASYVQEIKNEADRRVAARASASTNPAASSAAHTPPPPVDDAVKNRARFIGTALRVLDPSANPVNHSRFDDLIVWHGGLSSDDEARLYVLVSNSDDVQLADLVRQRPAIIMVAVSRIKLPPAPVTFLQFRQKVAADTPLTALINTFFQNNKAVPPLKFWKAVEHAYPSKVRDTAALAQLMNLGDDTVNHTLNLAPNVLESISAELNAKLIGSGLVQASKDARDKALRRLKKALK